MCVHDVHYVRLVYVQLCLMFLSYMYMFSECVLSI